MRVPMMKAQSVQTSHLEPAVVSDTEAVPLSDLRDLLEQAIGSLGYTEKEVDVIVEVLITIPTIVQELSKQKLL